MTNGIAFYFTVTALNAAGESAGSAQASALPRLGTWSTKTQMPTRLYGHSTAAVNGIIYVIGGQWTKYDANGTFLEMGLSSEVMAYDPATDTWTAKSATPAKRREQATAVVNGIIYIIGGQYNSAVSTVEAYDPGNRHRDHQSAYAHRARRLVCRCS